MEGDNVSENHILEMYEAGESVEEIASVLGLTILEVENILFG